MFAALREPNFRLYFAGQSVSLVGTWAQRVAQSWLVLELTGSGTALGLVVAAQFLPVLLVGPYGGLVADRADKRRLLMVTQTALGALAAVLGVLTVTHVVTLWMVVLFAVAFGCVSAVDNPTRQTFVPEIVGRDLLRNAVSLNSVVVNAARAVGPAAAGLVIAAVGVGVCFLANAASFAAVLLALTLIRPARLLPAEPVVRGPGQVQEGLRYVGDVPALWVSLAMMALIGTLAYEFQVVLPLLARSSLHGDARTYGFLTSAMGVGAVIGGLRVAARGRIGVSPVVVAAGAFAVALGAAAVVPSLGAELAALAVVGAASTTFMATSNTTLQLISAPSFRGRVMALRSVMFLGTTPIGGPIVGAISQGFGARAGLAVGALACLGAAALGVVMLRHMPPEHRLIPHRSTVDAAASGSGES